MAGHISARIVVLVAALLVGIAGCATHEKAQAPVSMPAENEMPAAEAAPEPAADIAAAPAESESAEPAEVSESAGPVESTVHVKTTAHAKSAARAKPTGHANTASAAAATVTMADQKFEPRKVTIRAGQAVQWKNTSKQPQSVTADHGLAKEKGSVSLPKGAKPFNSGNMKPGATYTHTFTVAGTYKYFSTDQEKNGMVGEVIVEKAATSAKVATKSQATKSTKVAKKKHATSTN